MFVMKCDLCKKEIDHNNRVEVRFASYKKVDLCEKCASPVFSFLEKNKFIDKKNKEIKKLKS